MSTRGVIAIARGDGWIGVYNHSDSHATWMGPRVWEHAQTIDYGAIEEAVLTGVNVITEERELDGELITSELDDIQGYIEWVWVFSPEVLTAYTSVKTTEPRPGQRREWIEPWTLRTLEGGIEQMGGYYFVHDMVGTFPLSDPEPDWRPIECGENLERCGHMSWVHDRSIQADPAYSPEMVEESRRFWGA